MLKVKRRRGMRWCFFEVLESRHSPLVLVGAPTQGCSSPLIHARIKCSLWADSLTLRHGESLTTAHKTTWVIHKLRRMITKLSITTEPSRCKHKLLLDHDKPNEKGGCTLATPYALIRSLIMDYQIPITPLGSYTPKVFLSWTNEQETSYGRVG
jgi:hypothetical protein